MMKGEKGIEMTSFVHVLAKWKYLILFLSVFTVVLSQRFLDYKQNGLANTVSLDGVGYYSYLPAAIIYQDFTYSFYDDKGNFIQQMYHPIFNNYDGKMYNKYYCGTAICLLPFFLIAIIISAIAGTDINGYTDTFLMMASIGSIFYFVLSVYFITKTCRFFSIPDKVSFFGTLIFFAATNLYHYVVQECTMSHMYSFFAISLFFYLFTELCKNKKAKNFIFFGMSFGLVFLVRPTNILIVLFLPFFFNNFKEFFCFLKTIFTENIKSVLLCILFFGLVVFLQFLLYYFQTGHFYIMSYDGETFDFANPEIFNVLFSYRKGLFIYTSFLLACFLFMISSKSYWYKKIVLVFTFLVFLYVISSWYCWWYGGSYGNRPFVDIYPIFVIMCILLYQKQSLIIKRMLLILTIPFIMVNQIMAVQFSSLIMDATYMNKEKFWDIFLQTNLGKINEHRINRVIKNGNIIRSETQTYENDSDGRVSEGGYKSQHGSFVNNNNQFSKGFGFEIKELNIKPPFYIIAECNAKTNFDGRDLALVIAADNNSQCVKWDVVFKKQFDEDANGWVKMSMVTEIKEDFMNDNTYMKIFGNGSKGEGMIDNLKYTVVKPK